MNMYKKKGDTRGGNVAKDSSPATSVAYTQNFTETDIAVNSSPVHLNLAEEYRMGRKRRGLALVFNQEQFFPRLELNSRIGTKADRNNMGRRLMELNFEVRIYDDLRMVDVLEEICGAAEENHSDADCFLLVFLSHGEKDHVYAYDGKIDIQEITSAFKGCKSLAGKPKIFILQACRGNEHDEPLCVIDAVDSETNETNMVMVDASAVHTLPAGADFIMCYSVAEGYFSHRETEYGSWYIQDLCTMIKKHGKSLEFTELLTLVNRMVSMRSVKNSRDPGALGKKQVPCFASMLTKKLYFR
ncbi:caspase-6-like [Cololabis saira]|uniref:caspase-6-like n=1 Tax=Cololabis saira TaxID=129043 RepID=UPI002AD4306E|nr:caspase-6-like [Cololabis saira]